MSWIAKAVLAAALLNCGLLNASAQNASPENIAPPDAAPAKEGGGQWLKDGDCSLFSADGAPGDTVSWTGACADGLAEGLGTATFTHDGQTQSFTASFSRGAIPDGHVISRWGSGWSYEGGTVGGRFNGQGILTTDAGDRFEGQWNDGKMNGFGVLLRANGERYTGDWKDNRANGNGELRRADGTLVSGLFSDGKLVADGKLLQAAAVAANPDSGRSAAAPGGAAADAPDAPSAPFGSVSGKTLTGVDGSTISLNLIEGGMELQVARIDGVARKSTFTFMTDRMGTVVEDSGRPSAGSSVTGFFRLTDKGVDIHYADGRAAMLSASPDGGVVMTLEGDGGPSCRAWYPAGHSFSDSEKKAALNAYASKLGLPVEANEVSSGCATAPKPQALNVETPPVALAPPARMAAKAQPRAERLAARTERQAEAKSPARMAKASYRIGDYKPASPVPVATVPVSTVKAAVEAVTVKSSEVHTIDAAITVPSMDVAAAPANPVNASQCLKVDSDGGHWGFRNSCDYAVQFAYCMAGGSNSLTACGDKNMVTVSAAGSVAAKGFGALMTDNSLQEKDAAHNFRWMACSGGAGEVVAYLDHFEPPAGRCERARTALAN